MWTGSQPNQHFLCWWNLIGTPKLCLLIRVQFNQKAEPKGPVTGNTSCWYGLFEFCTKDQPDDKKKLLCNWNCRKRKWGSANIARKEATKVIKEFCVVVGVDTTGVNNMAARKTFVQTALKSQCWVFDVLKNRLFENIFWVSAPFLK